MARDWLNLTWREKTWNERGQTVLANTIAGAVGVAMFVGFLYLAGQAIDAQDNRSMERHRCLKNATNGLEIEECGR